MSGAVAPGSWREGQDRIDWARQFMPATGAVAAELAASGLLRGVRVAVSEVLEPKTAATVLALADAGADPAVTSAGRNTDAAVAAALRRHGIPVYAEADADRSRDRENALALLGHAPEVIVDDGSALIRLAHTEREDLTAGIVGATEQTTSGVRPLRTMERAGQLRFPVIAGNDARTKSLFDNAHGTGQSVVFAIADLLGEPLAGARVVVIGFGLVGSGIARHAAALGARVTVTEVDPVAALQAAFAGFRVTGVDEAVADADIVISATGIAGTVDVPQLRRLREGAVVAVGGGVHQEVALAEAARQGAVEVAREGRISWLALPDGPTVRVLDDGNCINVSAAEGNPVQIMDLSFGVQLAAVGHLLEQRGSLAPGVHTLPRAVDDRVAAHALAAFGGAIDVPTDRQREFLASWRPDESASPWREDPEAAPRPEGV